MDIVCTSFIKINKIFVKTVKKKRIGTTSVHMLHAVCTGLMASGFSC